jgi:hypothetical protein
MLQVSPGGTWMLLKLIVFQRLPGPWSYHEARPLITVARSRVTVVLFFSGHVKESSSSTGC